MRWLFLFVLALNLVYIGLEMNGSSSGNSPVVPTLKNVQPIVLLSELKQPQPDLAKTEQEDDDLEVAAADSAPVETSSAGLPGSALSDVKQIDAGQAVAKLQEVAEKNPETDEADIVSALAVQPDVENAATETAMSAGREEHVDIAQTESPQSTSCFTLGPFRDLSKLRSLTREIKSYVLEADFRGREEKEPTLYWVFVKPEKNRTQAIRTGKRLKAKKIRDFYVIRNGEKINGLSLGHFRNKKSAYGLAKKVRNLDFDVIVEPVFRTYTIYWLDYQLAGGVNIPESILEKYTRSSKKQKISRLSRDCGV